jgi:hypothetical protein
LTEDALPRLGFSTDQTAFSHVSGCKQKKALTEASASILAMSWQRRCDSQAVHAIAMLADIRRASLVALTFQPA